MENEIRMIIKNSRYRIINLNESLKDNVELYINNEKYYLDSHGYSNLENDGEYKVILKFKVKVNNCHELFYDCRDIKYIDLTSFYAKDITDMSRMFYDCKNLQKVDLSNFDAVNLINMDEMFRGCDNLNDVNLNSFNAIKVTNMKDIFYDCGLKNINLSFINTLSLVNISGMFRSCKELTNVNFSFSFCTNNVTNMSNMFSGCHNLKDINFLNLNTMNVTNMSGMFSHSNLLNVDLSFLNCEKVEDMSFFFQDVRI